MSKQREVPGIRPYNGPAGGWGALKATAQAVRQQMEVVQAPVLLLRTCLLYTSPSPRDS